jgi:hypothetical protein
MAAIAAPLVEMATLEASAAPTPKAQTLDETIRAKAVTEGINPELARKIAFCESTTRQFTKDGQVLRGLHNSDDVGVFQINEAYHLKKSQELGFDIYSTEGNIGYAMWLLKNEGERHWKWSQPCWDK